MNRFQMTLESVNLALDINTIISLFMRPICRSYYGMARASVLVRLSWLLFVGLSAKLVNMTQTEPFQLGRSNLVHITTYDKKTIPIDFQGQGSKVKDCQTWYSYFVWQEDDTYCFSRSGSKFKVTCKTLLLKLANTLQTEQFQLGMSKLAHILTMTWGRHLLLFKVKVTC